MMHNSEVTIDVATNESTLEASGQVDTKSTLGPANGQVDSG